MGEKTMCKRGGEVTGGKETCNILTIDVEIHLGLTRASGGDCAIRSARCRCLSVDVQVQGGAEVDVTVVVLIEVVCIQE